MIEPGGQIAEEETFSIADDSISERNSFPFDKTRQAGDCPMGGQMRPRRTLIQLIDEASGKSYRVVEGKDPYTTRSKL
jgi:hypothetical protein